MLTASVYAYENKRNKVISVCNNKGKRFGLPTRKKLLYTVANPARGLLNREKKKTKKKKSVVSHIQRIGCQPEKLANPARGLLNREKNN